MKNLHYRTHKASKARFIFVGICTLTLFIFLVTCAVWGSQGNELIDFNLYQKLKYALLALGFVTVFNFITMLVSFSQQKEKSVLYR